MRAGGKGAESAGFDVRGRVALWHRCGPHDGVRVAGRERRLATYLPCEESSCSGSALAAPREPTPTAALAESASRPDRGGRGRGHGGRSPAEQLSRHVPGRNHPRARTARPQTPFPLGEPMPQRAVIVSRPTFLALEPADENKHYPTKSKITRPKQKVSVQKEKF